MDDPGLDKETLQNAVDDINKINRLLGGFKFMLEAVKEEVSRLSHLDTIVVVDAGCGDGEMLRYLSRHLNNKKVNFLGLDFAVGSIENARAKSRGFEQVRFRESDILTTQPHELECDIMISSLTMHHFNDDEIIEWLKTFKKLTIHSIIINDLHRHRFAFFAFTTFASLVIKHRISLHDGAISIASGFKKSNFTTYAAAIGCNLDRLKWKWSFRYIWTVRLDECKN